VLTRQDSLQDEPVLTTPALSVASAERSTVLGAESASPDRLHCSDSANNCMMYGSAHGSKSISLLWWARQAFNSIIANSIRAFPKLGTKSRCPSDGLLEKQVRCQRPKNCSVQRAIQVATYFLKGICDFIKKLGQLSQRWLTSGFV
jgi:hypothetical protein